MKRICLEIGGKTIEAWAEKINGTLWLHHNGETTSFRPTQKNYGSGGAGVSEDGVSAPMPGKIVKTLCKVGDKVHKGQVLVAMEAMKMEYSLKADRDGVVKTVSCTPDQQVELGAILVSLEAVDGEG